MIGMHEDSGFHLDTTLVTVVVTLLLNLAVPGPWLVQPARFKGKTLETLAPVRYV